MFTLPLLSDTATLENAGGKGASLARLTRLGLPVPPGFIVTTAAYRLFVQVNDLGKAISASLEGLVALDGAGLDRASASIRLAFSEGRLPKEVEQEVLAGYLALQSQAAGLPRENPSDARSTAFSVAVRSSATTEDLPELSFAGQQDTYLNILGQEQLFKALVDCWSSLWTARALGYRIRNEIPHQDAALAVIVQTMLQSELSGVLFTANPLTGLLNETVIDATFGLGEALVSGQVEPDHFVVDSFSGTIRSLTLGGKQTSIRSKSGGGVESLQEEAAGLQTLTGNQVRQLVASGQQIQKEYGSPQDIEWAYSGGEMYLLQARPITSLFPIPRVSFDPLLVWFSFGAFQGLVGPMTPLGQESIQRVVLGVSTRLGLKIDYSKQAFFDAAGERIWIRINDLIRNPLGMRFLGALSFVDPSVRQILLRLITDPRLGAGKGRVKFSSLRRLLHFLSPAIPLAVQTILQPEQARRRFDDFLEDYLRSVQIAPGVDRFERLANFAAFMGAQGGLADALPSVLPRFLPIFAPAMASLAQIGHLLPRQAGVNPTFSMDSMEITRGLPNNVTTGMDLELWQTANLIMADTSSKQLFQSTTAAILAAGFREGTLPPVAQSAVKRFMDKYGVRGVGEIDLGQPRWREDPTPVMHSLQSYLQIQPEFAPDRVFEQGARAAEDAIQRLSARARHQPGGWIKQKLLRGAALRVRLLMGARESPKFFAVRAMGIVRNYLLEVGEQFAAAGTIDRPEDLFFLHVSELEELSRQETRDWKTLIASRRSTYARELRRRQVPRVLVSDGRVFYEGLGAATDGAQQITGSPVSAGVVEGIVHVVLDPRGAQLAPGEILVCPGTDPAWTPLFMAAGGLVMEVGGMMTHGSVVAREYGIPAVVGVHQATLRLKDGQRIRLDGTHGRIAIL